MKMKNIFESEITSEIVNRINKLTPITLNLWGRMNASQMLAHCNVTYEMVYTNNYPKPSFIKEFILKAVVKKAVVGGTPYQKNGRTAPQFIITNERDFEEEKNLLIGYLIKTQNLGETHFNGKKSHSFGTLTSIEWSNLLYKHIDHHLSQFGV